MLRVFGVIIVAALLGLSYAGFNANREAMKLHPTTGTQSPYVKAFSKERLLLGCFAALGLIVIFTSLWLTGWLDVSYPILVAVVLFFTSLPVMSLGQRASGSHVKESIVSVLERSLESLEFNVVSGPQTGKPEVDPLIRKIDLFAFRSSC